MGGTTYVCTSASYCSVEKVCGRIIFFINKVIISEYFFTIQVDILYLCFDQLDVMEEW